MSDIKITCKAGNVVATFSGVGNRERAQWAALTATEAFAFRMGSPAVATIHDDPGGQPSIVAATDIKIGTDVGAVDVSQILGWIEEAILIPPTERGTVALAKDARATITALVAEIARLTALRCDCDEESGLHAPTCMVMVREQNEAMSAEIARLTAELAAARKDLDAAAEAGIKRGRSWEATEWEAAFGVRNRREAVDKLRAAEEQLAAVRAVPADVEAAIESLRRAEEVDARAMTGQSLAARVLAEAALRAAITRAIAAAKAAPPAVRRVGEVLATLDPNGDKVIEFDDGDIATMQIALGPHIAYRMWDGERWGTEWEGDEVQHRWLAMPCRIVPAHLADDPPESRRPIGGEKGGE